MTDEAERQRKAFGRRGHVIAGNYVLGDVLGVGGMGIVHAAVQRSLERNVAIKVPRKELVGDEFVRERFRSEALAASRISHRNIVRVFDYGDDGGAPYLVMEHVIGPRLGQVLHENGPLPIDTAVHLVAQIVEGVEDAHAHGIVHADLKCDNILLETMRDGSTRPRLIDFGIARFVGEAFARPPGEHMITGTPEYVAPEVIRGAAPTFASDVYAIGVMLYELVTGSPPFGGGVATAVMCEKLESEAVPMTWRCPELDIPVALDELVRRALAREPSERFENATFLARALEEAVEAHAGVGFIPPPSERSVFSTEATTATMHVSEAHAPHSPVAPIMSRRCQVIRAINASDVNGIAVAYLDLARGLLDERKVAQAIAELEEGVELLSTHPSAPVWRLLLSLAALYDGNGDRERARTTARAACTQADACGSSLGRERAQRLCERLARRRASTRRVRAW